MRHLILDPSLPIESRLLDAANTDGLGGGAISRSIGFCKPYREFTIKSWENLLQDQAEIIRNAIHGGRITAVYWLQIAGYDTITEPIFIADGNNVQLEFPTPFNDIYAPSWILKVNQTVVTNWTCVGDTFVFTSAPSGRITGTGKRRYRVIIQANNDSLLNEQQLFVSDEGQVYSLAPVVFTEVEGVNIF